jgi:hypothetical protein
MPPRSSLLRAGLAVLAIVQGTIAVWALVAPRSFHSEFPGPGSPWVAPLGPYDEHLVRDAGALSLALTLVLVAALVWLERRLVIVAAAAYLAWELPHLAFHLTADDALTTSARVLSEAGQVLATLVAIAVLAGAVRWRAPERG